MPDGVMELNEAVAAYQEAMEGSSNMSRMARLIQQTKVARYVIENDGADLTDDQRNALRSQADAVLRIPAQVHMSAQGKLIQRQSIAKQVLELVPAAVPASGRKETPLDGPIFIVHGRDEAGKHHVARVVEQMTGREALILHEQPNKGQTIIEKLLGHAGAASYAIVILTGDDEARLKGSDEPLRARGRQNVILELGLFLGLLGRERVAVLYEPGVELPSDYAGVAYTPFDNSNGWKLELAREMKAAGIEADANAAK